MASLEPVAKGLLALAAFTLIMFPGISKREVAYLSIERESIEELLSEVLTDPKPFLNNDLSWNEQVIHDRLIEIFKERLDKSRVPWHIIERQKWEKQKEERVVALITRLKCGYNTLLEAFEVMIQEYLTLGGD